MKTNKNISTLPLLIFLLTINLSLAYTQNYVVEINTTTEANTTTLTVNGGDQIKIHCDKNQTTTNKIFAKQEILKNIIESTPVELTPSWPTYTIKVMTETLTATCTDTQPHNYQFKLSKEINDPGTDKKLEQLQLIADSIACMENQTLLRRELDNTQNTTPPAPVPCTPIINTETNQTILQENAELRAANTLLTQDRDNARRDLLNLQSQQAAQNAKKEDDYWKWFIAGIIAMWIIRFLYDKNKASKGIGGAFSVQRLTGRPPITGQGSWR